MRWNYYKLRQLSLLQSATDSYYKLRQLFYYKVRHGLLQIATGITKCDDYYKLRQYKCSLAGARQIFALLANFLFLLVLAKKSQCSACSRMLAKTIHHPFGVYEFWTFRKERELLFRLFIFTKKYV